MMGYRESPIEKFKPTFTLVLLPPTLLGRRRVGPKKEMFPKMVHCR
jgi:hypothetical protein